MKFSKNESPSPKKAMLFSTLAAVIITAVMLFVFAFVMTLCDIPKTLAAPLSSVAVGIGCFFGGRKAASTIGENGYLCGITVAATVVFIITVCGMITFAAGFTAQSLLRAAIALLSGCIGGISGVNKPKKNKLVK